MSAPFVILFISTLPPTRRRTAISCGARSWSQAVMDEVGWALYHQTGLQHHHYPQRSIMIIMPFCNIIGVLWILCNMRDTAWIKKKKCDVQTSEPWANGNTMQAKVRFPLRSIGRLSFTQTTAQHRSFLRIIRTWTPYPQCYIYTLVCTWLPGL